MLFSTLNVLLFAELLDLSKRNVNFADSELIVPILYADSFPTSEKGWFSDSLRFIEPALSELHGFYIYYIHLLLQKNPAISRDACFAATLY